MKLMEQVSLKKFNTFGIECTARWLADYSSVKALRELIKTDVYATMPRLLVGQGSNLLFLNDYDGLVIHSSMKSVRIAGHDNESVVLEAGAGVIWDELVSYAVGNGWWGVENLSLIPGEVGAAAVQNIGAYGVELCDVLESVTVVDLSTGQELILSVKDCSYGYRTSIFKTTARNDFAIVSVRIKLSRKARPQFSYPHLEQEVRRRGELTLENIRRTIIEIRSSKLPNPAVMGNAGSFFMNPVIPASQFESLLAEYAEIPHYISVNGSVKIPAAWLIERCGWKGKAMGRAGVHEHQPLVLVNLGGATGKEIALLADAVGASVNEKFGINLIPEVNYIS